ncbi:MAG: phycobilisome rod-core linker polypeptide [Cyanobacteria bacterium P01_F01_bin.3]
MINNTLFRPSVLRESRKKFNPEGFDLAAAIKARKAAEAAPPSAEEQARDDALLSPSELAAFSAYPAVELIPGSSLEAVDAVIYAAYKQVFGNAHLMDSEKSPLADSQLRSGQITVMEFVRQLAKSDRYRTLFFESCTNLRSVELNFKHLLGRAPKNSEEVSYHIQILSEKGFAAEIDTYINSEEYYRQFGTTIVPYYRGYETEPGRSLAGFTHAFPLLRGASSSNKSMTPAGNATEPQLQSALLSNKASEIKTLASLPAVEPLIVADEIEVPPTPEELLEKAFQGVAFTPVGRPYGYYKSDDFLETPKELSSWLQEYSARDAASKFPAARESQPVTLPAGASEDAAEVVIRAAYKQVFGNAYLMESQRLVDAEAQLKEGRLSVKGFVRELAKSEIYQALFVEKSSNVRLIELNFKHLLGRAPDSGQEISEHAIRLVENGFEADIDSYIDGVEYNDNFGEDTVPYYVSYATQPAKSGAGYSRIFQVIKGACSSDKSIDASQRSQLQTGLLKPATPVKKENVFNPEGFRLVKALGFEESPPSIATPYFNAFADCEPVECIPGASAQRLSIVIEAAYKQVFGNAYLMESERSPVAESQLRSGQITVMEFVRLLAKSQQYADVFFTPYTNVEAIKLNFKHLLGRAPESAAEISEHVEILANGGFEAEIDSYIDSDEYVQSFGVNIVPYYRGYKSQTGKTLAGFTHSFSLLKGASSSNKSVARDTYLQLDKSLLSNSATEISAFATESDTLDVQNQSAKAYQVAPIRYVSPYGSSIAVTSTASSSVSQYIQPKQSSIYLQTVLTAGKYESLESASPISWMFGSSEQDLSLVISAVYKQVLGNAHIMDSERLTTAESQLRSGKLTIREFVRVVAKSDLYKARFVNNSPRYRSHEVNFKHLLGRAPDNYEETRFHSDMLDGHGYEADIDSYIDSDEYQESFGEDTVPYYRGYKTQSGQSMVGYNNMLRMLPSVSSSDKAIASANKPQLQTQLLPMQAPVAGNYSASSSGGSASSSQPVDLIRQVLGLS